MNETKVPAVVIGAGVVGCAVAYELALRGLEPLVLEKGPRIAEGTTSRNSGVIHAGIYYSPGSLKAESCIRGNALLYEWCAERGVPHKKTGKWIVGTLEDEQDISELFKNAAQCGALGLEMLGGDRLSSSLSGVKAQLGIFSKETGIVDPFEYSRSMQVAAEEKGAMFLLNTPVSAIDRSGSEYKLTTSRGEIDAEIIINCAGLYADEIARMAGIDRYRIFPWRGDYFKLSTRAHYPHLIYPVKKKRAPGLGIHLTITLDGSYKLGPDVQYVQSKEDFSNPLRLEEKRKAFFEAASRYLSGISLEQISYDSCGIRPKLRSPEDHEEKDFIISEDLPGFINLIGIESPGLTASKDLAERVVKLCAV